MPKLALIVATAFVLSACGGSDDGGSVATVAPTVGEVVHGSSVDLSVKLQGAKLVPATTTHIVPDEGHLHVILDDTLISMTQGLEQTIPDVPPGEHRITVEFVASDHAPFDPRVVSVVAFEVEP